MFETRNDIAAKTRTSICEMLQQHLSNALDLQAQSKQAHWTVRGPEFYSLHLLFDKINSDVIGYVDRIAERIGQLGGYVDGSPKRVASDSQISPYPLNIVNSLDHVSALASSLASFGAYIRKGIKKADDLGDDVTADILTQIGGGVDSWLWMVEAHLQGAGELSSQSAASMKSKVKVVGGKR